MTSWNTELRLPARESKPRLAGWTIVIDNGVPLRHFEDVIESYGAHIDLVKFGWGTSLVTPVLEAKTRCLRAHEVDYFFGGTLFEKFHIQGKADQYREYCLRHGCRYVELSNGTVPLTNEEKDEYIYRFARDFRVLSEVGYKDAAKSLNLSPARWIQFMKDDLAAGAVKVITEARESGTSGICRSDGEVRFGLIEEILDSEIPVQDIVFEAPNKTLQTYFIHKVGPAVNLANIPFDDAVALETLRLGLRSDTLMLFEEGAGEHA
ncbi:MAG: phosphosulfolactate synthase [Alicyclobacillaceae bacterium]|nr:phosphosulfolactate synthase [Alicyclobacillaceae bacterium]